MKTVEKPMLDTEKVAEQWPKFRGEYRALIGDDWVQKAVMTHYHVYYNLYKSRCIDGNLNRFVVDHLDESINDN